MDFKDFPPIGGLMVSKMIVEEGIRAGFMYRDKRSSVEDSGWRIFTGLEPEEYMGDPANFGIYSPSTVLEIDASIAELLLKGVGSVYERLTDDGVWDKVTDYALEDDYMVKHELTNDWILEINNLFERQPEENGDLLYTTGDKSVRLAIWREEGKSIQEIYEEHKKIVDTRDQSEARTLEKFDFSDSDVLRVGYLIKESDENKEYSALYGFSMIDNLVLASVFYFDNGDDLDWAIETWKNIKAR